MRTDTSPGPAPHPALPPLGSSTSLHPAQLAAAEPQAGFHSLLSVQRPVCLEGWAEARAARPLTSVWCPPNLYQAEPRFEACTALVPCSTPQPQQASPPPPPHLVTTRGSGLPAAQTAGQEPQRTPKRGEPRTPRGTPSPQSQLWVEGTRENPDTLTSLLQVQRILVSSQSILSPLP